MCRGNLESNSRVVVVVVLCVLGVWLCWVGVLMRWCHCHCHHFVLVRTTMKAAAKCDTHCELRDSVNHLRVERVLFFRLVLQIMFVFSGRCCCCVGGGSDVRLNACVFIRASGCISLWGPGVHVTRAAPWPLSRPQGVNMHVHNGQGVDLRIRGHLHVENLCEIPPEPP